MPRLHQYRERNACYVLTASGELAMFTHALDLDELLQEGASR